MHIVSGVHGKLAPGQDAFDLFARRPGGYFVRRPKVRAMQIIDEIGLSAGAFTAARWATSAGRATWIRRLRFAQLVFPRRRL